MLSPDQQDEFERPGLLRLPDAIPGQTPNAMRDRLWRHLPEGHGVAPERPPDLARPVALPSGC
jgi:hypothetical protein